jgi:hypothetical protein
MLGPSLCAAQQVPNDNGASFTSFQIGEDFATYPTSINGGLSVTGYYINKAGIQEGFMRSADGEVTTFSVAGSVLTSPVAINAAGEIAGRSVDANGNAYGFVRYANGSIATFLPGGNKPGATNVAGINKEGTIVGDYATTNTVSPQHGFIRSVDGAITTFDVPGSDRTEPVAINAVGEIAGIYWFDGNARPGGFVRSADGDIITFDFYPGIPVSINAGGSIAGWYVLASGALQGFVRFPHGAINSFAAPGGLLEAPHMGINQAGSIFGNFYILGPLISYEVFLRSANGTMTSFEFPGSLHTTATSMSDSDVITGSYSMGSEVFGFLRIPVADQSQ